MIYPRSYYLNWSDDLTTFFSPFKNVSRIDLQRSVLIPGTSNCHGFTNDRFMIMTSLDPI